MTRKISVYVDDDFHRALKAAASLQGMSLSEFVVRATRQALKMPDRRTVAGRMDAIRRSIDTRFSTTDIRQMREEGRRK